MGLVCAVVRALVPQQCGPGSTPAPCHMWVLVLLREFFSGFSGFPLSTKTNTYKLANLTRTENEHENQLRLM